jgi:lactoylglutathione lyase
MKSVYTITAGRLCGLLLLAMLAGALLCVWLRGLPATAQNTKNNQTPNGPMKEKRMELGAFSVSLTVKDIKVSKDFYEKLGFKVFHGDITQNWLILKNGNHVIGLFQGMLERNTLTFNPGWDQNAQKIETFTDVRELQKQLKAQGMKFVIEADEKTTGPASFMVMDPDGNPILFDQHV